jgi:hypothetical protein
VGNDREKRPFILSQPLPRPLVVDATEKPLERLRRRADDFGEFLAFVVHWDP